MKEIDELTAGITSKSEARFMVDKYYREQDARMRCEAQNRSSETPLPVVVHFARQHKRLEGQAKRELQKYAEADPVGRWMLSIPGIGPVISAGLLAHIDITRAAHAGNIWSFAGLNPKRIWKKGQKRPHNADLKTLVAYKLGECFVRAQAVENEVYGSIFAEKKRELWQQNAEGKFVEAAKVGAQRVRKDTEAYKWYSGQVSRKGGTRFAQGNAGLLRQSDMASEGQPMLPPAHIHARARRYTVKLFLSHLHHVWYWTHYKKAPPVPYIFDDPAHTHFIPPPNWTDPKMAA